MKVLIHKAAATGTDPTPDLRIEATEPFPEFRDDEWATKGAALHQLNAERIGNALLASLPGGTLDRLVVHLLAAKCTHLRVAHK